MESLRVYLIIDYIVLIGFSLVNPRGRRLVGRTSSTNLCVVLILSFCHILFSCLVLLVFRLIFLTNYTGTLVK